MEEADFVCSSKDCNQKTLLEEKRHLSHKRKHDMVLTLNKPSHFSSDETPTPTRFIRNCEAIGLFQDLQNVNPFDETFKKAAEAAKKGEVVQNLSVNTLSKPAGEDLHTPHIDLTATNSHLQASDNGAPDNHLGRVIRTEADTSLKPLSRTNSLSDDSKGKQNSSDPDLRLFVRMPDGSLVQIPTIGGLPGTGNSPTQPNTSPRTIIISTQNTSPGLGEHHRPLSPSPRLAGAKPFKPAQDNPPNAASAAVRQKLKAALLKSGKPLQTPSENEGAQQAPSPSSSNEHLPSDARRERRVSSTTVEEDLQRRQKTLERNRIAAMRCREKRKKWVNELREKYDKMCMANEALIKEVTFLRGEVTRLKSALMVAYNPPHTVQDVMATSVQIVENEKEEAGRERERRRSGGREEEARKEQEDGGGGSTTGRRAGLRLDVGGPATSLAAPIDLDSPLVSRDVILTSTALPTTPNEYHSFPEFDKPEGEVPEEKMSSVIQINPNALSKIGSSLS